jgi:hypothetical protein
VHESALNTLTVQSSHGFTGSNEQEAADSEENRL